MPTIDEIQQWTGAEVHDRQGEKVGKLDHVYVDRQTGEPTFGAVKTGLFGNRVSLVPIGDARREGDDVVITHTKDAVKDAPNVDADQELSEAEEDRLYQHYQLSHRDAEGTTGATGTTGTAGTTGESGTRGAGDRVGNQHGTEGRDTSGPMTDDAMTRSEEELRVGTERRETGRARLRKHVVTEHVQTTVPVQREEVHVEREPITDANVGNATDGPAISEEEHEITLHEERPVVEKEVVPKERVRLEKDVQTDEAAVEEDVRKERIDTDGPQGGQS